MKNYLKIMSLICLLLCSQVNAQKLSIKYSTQEKTDGKYHSSTSSSFLDLAEDDYFSYERIEQGLMDSKKLVVKKVEKRSGRKIWEKTLPVDAYNFGRHEFFCELKKVDGGFYLFMKSENAKKKESILTAQKFDENLKEKGEPEIVATSKIMSTSKYDMLNFSIKDISGNFLVYTYPYEIKDKPIKFTLIDNKLNNVWEKDIEFPKGQYYSLKEVNITEGSILNALFIVSTNLKKISDGAIAEYRVVSSNSMDNTIKNSSIKFSGQFKYFGDDFITFDTINQKIVISGQYHKTLKNKGYEGVFNVEFDLKTMLVTHSQIIPYTKSMLEQMIGLKAYSKGKLPTNFVLINQSINNAGDNIFVLEYRANSIVQSNNSTFTSTYYSFDNLILFKSNAKSEVVWFKNIVKSSNDRYANYTPAYSTFSNENTILFFNASEATFKTPSQLFGYTYSELENTLVVMVYNKDGDLVAQDGFVTVDSKGVMCDMKSIKKIDNNNFELIFDKVSNTYKKEATTKAVLNFEE